MHRDSERVAAANEALSRKVNEGIERGQWPGQEDERTAYRCECSREDCNRLIELTQREYEDVRAHPRRFLVFPSHEQPEIETVIRIESGYVVVEKGGAAGVVAEASDPRE